MVNFFAETFLVLLSSLAPQQPLLFYDPAMVLQVVDAKELNHLYQEHPDAVVLGKFADFPPLALFYPLPNGPLPPVWYAQREGRYLVPLEAVNDLPRFQLVRIPMKPHNVPPSPRGKLRSEGRVLYDLSYDTWDNLHRGLTGYRSFPYEGESYTVHTRYVFKMVEEPHPNAMAVEYITQTLQEMGYEPQILPYQFPQCPSHVNIEVTIPGVLYPEEYVLATAHYDDICFPFSDYACDHEDLPGADDNASGATALLAFADALKDVKTERSIRLVWFSGEELGLCGSLYYANQWFLEDRGTIVSVINADMFGYDGNNDDLFEIHAGTLSESIALGEIIEEQAIALGLNPQLYTADAITASDHASFWQFGIPAVEIGEDFDEDFNPYYHSSLDNRENMDLEHTFQVTRALFYALQVLAHPYPKGKNFSLLGPVSLAPVPSPTLP